MPLDGFSLAEHVEIAREAERLTLYEWFEGGRLSRSELRQWQIFESLSKTNSKRLLVSLILLLRHLGYQGLIILLDELETVLLQSASVRNAAYENVRLLIDNAEQGHHLHVFFSIIPDVLLADKGFKAYDALWSRVRSAGESRRLNYRSIVIDLHRTTLFIDVAFGPIEATKRVPAGGTYFNFETRSGIGATIQLQDHLYLLAGTPSLEDRG